VTVQNSRKIWKSESIRFILFLILSTFISFLLCETFYFSFLYSADNLFLPVFIQDMFRGEWQGWILPPSPYFFPDGIVMGILYLCFPFLYLPTVYGVFQFLTFQLGIYIFWKFRRDSYYARKYVYQVTLFLWFFIILSIFFDESPKILHTLFASAHHSTGFLFILFLLGVRILFPNLFFDTKSKLMLALFVILFFFLYISDRLAFSIGGVFYLMILQEKNQLSRFPNNRILYIFFLIVFFGELTLFYIQQLFSIPKSFFILQQKIFSLDLFQILSLSIHYLYDFFKVMFYKTPTLFFLLGLSFLAIVFQGSNKRKLSILFFSFSLLVTLLIGRFTYENPFPIRYFFPFLIYSLLTGIIQLNHVSDWSYFPSKKIQILLTSCLKISILIFLVFSFYVKTERFDVSLKLPPPKEVDYEREKPIRFWSEGKWESIPVTETGEPYKWITGAFRLRSSHTP